MTVITITNRKGGVGKTTVSTHLAAGLATLGYRIALIDTDSQGHCAATLQMPYEDGLYNLLVNKHPIESVLREVPAENYTTPEFPAKGALYLIPSAERTHKIPYELEQTDLFSVLQLVDHLRQEHRLHAIIVDTNPTLTALESYIYMATDAYIYVTETERLSSEAVDRIIPQIQEFSKQRQAYLNRRSVVLGIVPNKVRPQTSAHQIGLEELGKRYGETVWSPLQLRTVWVEASLVGQLVYNYAPSSSAAQEAWALVKRAIESLKQSQLPS